MPSFHLFFSLIFLSGYERSGWLYQQNTLEGMDIEGGGGVINAVSPGADNLGVTFTDPETVLVPHLDFEDAVFLENEAIWGGAVNLIGQKVGLGNALAKMKCVRCRFERNVASAGSVPDGSAGITRASYICVHASKNVCPVSFYNIIIMSVCAIVPLFAGRLR